MEQQKRRIRIIVYPREYCRRSLYLTMSRSLFPLNTMYCTVHSHTHESRKKQHAHCLWALQFFVCSPVSSRIYLLCYLTSNRILNWIVACFASLPLCLCVCDCERLLHASTTGMTIIIIILLACRMMSDIYKSDKSHTKPISIHSEKTFSFGMFVCDWYENHCEKELIRKVVNAQMKSERNDNYFCVCVFVLTKAVAKYFSGKMTRSYLIWTVIHK